MISATKFLDLVAPPLVEEIKAIESLKKFTTNTDIVGAHAEAIVRRLICRVVAPLRVSTGAVISEELCEEPSSIPPNRHDHLNQNSIPTSLLSVSYACERLRIKIQILMKLLPKVIAS